MTKRERNKHIAQAFEKLNEAYRILDDIAYEEEMSLENWPESMQESDRYYEAEERSDKVADLRDDLDNLRDTFEEILGL